MITTMKTAIFPAGLVFGAVSALLLLAGCNSTGPDDENTFDPDKPYAWVYDDCGDSLRVNWKFDPSHPGDVEELLFDSVNVPALRIREYANHSDTVKTTVKVGVAFSTSSQRWELVEGGSYEDEGSSSDNYDQYYLVFLCPTYGAPKILGQPENITVDDGEDAFFAVNATDGTSDNDDDYDHNLYVWYINGETFESAFDGYEYEYSTSEVGVPVTMANHNAKIRVVVTNGYNKVVSKEVTLTVRPAAPSITRIEAFEVYPSGLTEEEEFDTVSVTSSYAGDSTRLRVETRGSVASYAWTHKGVAVGTSSPVLSLGRLPKSDSGTVVRCIVSNAAGKDTAEYKLKIISKPWYSETLYVGLPTSTSYGSLLDLDTTYSSDYDNFPSTTMTSRQGNIDLVMGVVSGSYKLLAPRIAKKLGISSTSALDSTKMATTKMVLITGSIPTQDAAATLYAQGTKLDSVTVSSSTGYFQGVSGTHVLLKTSRGYLYIIESPGSYSSSSQRFYFSSRRGSIKQ
jgi:hypothetical protein